MPIFGNYNVCKEICDVLGLKHVKRLDLHMAVHEIVTVTAEYFPEIDGVMQLVPILKKFELVEKKETILENEYGLDSDARSDVQRHEQFANSNIL